MLQPRLIRHFHKSSRFEVPLRNLPELATPEVYKDTVHRLARLLSHYRRPAFVLRLESEEARCLGTPTAQWSRWPGKTRALTRSSLRRSLRGDARPGALLPAHDRPDRCAQLCPEPRLGRVRSVRTPL